MLNRTTRFNVMKNVCYKECIGKLEIIFVLSLRQPKYSLKMIIIKYTLLKIRCDSIP